MIAAIIQARMGSNRFPGKVLKDLNGKPVIQYIIENMEKLKSKGHIDEYYFAIPNTNENLELVEYLKTKNVNVYTGSDSDVLDRFYQCAKETKIDTIVRICADTPFTEPWQISQQIENFNKTKKFSYGNGAWVFSYEELEDSWKNGHNPEDREHVVTRMYNAIDYPEDLEKLRKFTKN